MRIYWLDPIGTAALGLMARPRAHDWLEDDIRSIQRQAVALVVCLLEQSELQELALEQEG